MTDQLLTNGFKKGFGSAFKPLDYGNALTQEQRKFTQLRRGWFIIGVAGVTFTVLIAIVNFEFAIIFFAGLAIAAQENIDLFGGY